MITLVSSKQLNLDFGYWNVTSSVDWCEPNFLHSTYIAETWNTFTNLFYIFLGIYAFYNSYKLKISVPIRFKLLFTCFIIVGLGSILFHATLQRWAQLIDELPMLYLISISLFSILCNDSKTSIFTQVLSIIFSAGISVGVSIYMYLHPDKPELFFISFGVITTSTFLFTLHKSYKIEKVPRIWGEATFFLLFGLTLWTFENNFCDSIEYLKLHSFWHLFSSLGGYRYGRLIQYIYYKTNYDKSLVLNDDGIHYFIPFIQENPNKSK